MKPKSHSPDFDSPQIIDKFYENLQYFLDEAPVFINDIGVVYIGRHQDCLQLLSSPQYVRQIPGKQFPDSPMVTMLRSWMIFLDPPKHTQLRNFFTPAFLPKNIHQFSPMIESSCQELISDIMDTPGEIDLVSRFAYPLPVLVFCELFGVPLPDRTLFKTWSHVITEATNRGSYDEINKAESTGQEICQYFQYLIADRQAKPGNDLLSELINKYLKDGTISNDEFIFNLVFLIFAAHENTKNLITNGMLTLMHHPQSFSMLQQNPQHIEPAIEEMLRFESPLQKISRWATEPSKFGDYEVPANTVIVALIGAANRDPLCFKHPNVFDITRKPNRHIAFGKGIHHCLGTTLARMEGQVAIAAIIRHFPDIKLVDFKWRCLFSFRSLEYLKVKTGL